MKDRAMAAASWLLGVQEWEESHKRYKQTADLLVEMQSRIEALEQFERAYNEWNDKTEWVQQTAKPQELGKHRADVLRERIEALEKDAARFLKLAAHMTFSLDGEYVTMDFSCPVDATKTHDVHDDWIEPRFTDSVRRTVDTAIQSEKGGV